VPAPPHGRRDILGRHVVVCAGVDEAGVRGETQLGAAVDVPSCILR
jgi:hypothetical protein